MDGASLQAGESSKIDGSPKGVADIVSDGVLNVGTDRSPDLIPRGIPTHSNPSIFLQTLQRQPTATHVDFGKTDYGGAVQRLIQ